MCQLLLTLPTVAWRTGHCCILANWFAVPWPEGARCYVSQSLKIAARCSCTLHVVRTSHLLQQHRSIPVTITTAGMMTTDVGAAGLHRRHILDAIRKRLHGRMVMTSSTSDDESGDAKRSRIDPVQSTCQSDVMTASCWKSAETCLSQQNTST